MTEPALKLVPDPSPSGSRARREPAIRFPARESGFRLEAELWLPQGREELFPFYGDAYNLESITPPWLHFEVLTPKPIEMKPGALIDYRLRLHGLPIRWRTEIARWEPPIAFLDQQLKGPYRYWRHEHLFEEADGGTRVIDRVDYDFFGGRLAHALIVRRDLEAIFSYRQRKLLERFGDG